MRLSTLITWVLIIGFVFLYITKENPRLLQKIESRKEVIENDTR